jgi:hypothetical protein
MPKVSLIKPGTGSTQWGTNVGQNWTDIENTFKQAMYQREVFEFCHEFLSVPVHEPFTPSNNGSGSAGNVMVAGEANHPGILQLETGTNAAGRAAIQTTFDCILLGGGAAVFEAVVRIPTLPTAAQAFAFRIGFGDLDTDDFNDGVYFELTQGSADWYCKTASGGMRTPADSGVAAQANTWTRLRVEVNAGGSEATFYIDGTSVATITTDIPTGAGHETGLAATIKKTNGTTERTAHIDCIYARIEFTTAR